MDKKKKKKNVIFSAILVVLAVIVGLITNKAFDFNDFEDDSTTVKVSRVTTVKADNKSYSLDNVPEYSGSAYVIINDNKPDFTEKDLTTESYEKYGKLDKLGRCTTCIACIGQDLMPTGEREPINSVKPTGWQHVEYGFVDGLSLYNRCHLIAHSLTAENANERNLITGTRYLNTEGMLPFEQKVTNYVRNTGNHVLYRVTPIFKGNELVARGVHMEGYSVEDNGKKICYNVYCYNVQPGIIIDYKTGKSKLAEEDKSAEKHNYIINVNNKKFHKDTCDKVSDIKDENKRTYYGTRDDLINGGYEPCGACKP